MIHSKIFSIDTSVFGKIAKDYFSGDKKRVNQAKNFIDFTVSKGLVPFFTYHHVQEILQHENDTVVFDRWSLIGRFPIVSWFCSFDDENVMGSIFDIHRIEAIKYLEEGNIDVKNLVAYVKSDFIKYSSGKEFLNKFERLYSQVRDLGLIDTQRGKEIESISHVRDRKIDRIKLTELNSSKLRSLPEIEDYLVNHSKTTEKLLIERGDEKLRDHEQVAKKFTESVRDNGRLLYGDDEITLLEKFVLAVGVKMSQINPKTTVGDLGYIAVFNSKMKLLAESFYCTIDDIPQESIPSWLIWREIDKIMKNEPNASGSNMVDKQMSVFVIYVDAMVVDKRVKECFSQLKRRASILSQSFSNVVKLSHYSKLKNKL